MKPAAALLIGNILLQACVSAPKASSQLDASSKQFNVVPGKAQLYIVRPSSFGMAVLYQVIVDGRVVGSPSR
jgi:starvation-inducible outer membrane lipoprotein